MTTKHILINGDCRNMSLIGDKSIHLIVTSPSYWQLKDYGTDNQIGFNDTYEQYINNLNLVWKECYRVLHDGCRLCINIGDQFARSVYYGRYKVIPIHSEIIRFCETIGFDYMGSIIWQKQTTMNTTGGGVVMGSFPFPRNGIIKVDYEYILIFKKQGIAPKPTEEQKKLSELTKNEWNTYFSSHWHFNGARQNTHIAMFPEELPYRLIKMFSFVDETILDPFMGSGTTALAAKNLNRNSIGYEINKDFQPYYKQKVEETSLYVNTITNYQTDNNSFDFADKYKDLPYLFKDILCFDKKVDVKKQTFGSKFSQEVNNKEELYSIKTILSPIKMVLREGKTIKLLGIDYDRIKEDIVIDYLSNMIKGKKVYLRYDNIKYDKDNNLLCYLFLQNKTFINAKLIKEGYVFTDKNLSFRYKDKFLKLEEEFYGKRMDIK